MKTVNYDFTLRAFLANKNAVNQVSVTSEPYLAMKTGAKVKWTIIGASSLSERSLPTSFIVLWEGKIASVARVLTSKRPPSALSSEKTRSLRQTARGDRSLEPP